jgi:hypothetical protein
MGSVSIDVARLSPSASLGFADSRFHWEARMMALEHEHDLLRSSLARTAARAVDE